MIVLFGEMDWQPAWPFVPSSTAGPARQERFRRVLDDGEAVRGGDGEDRRHVGGAAAHVNRHDGLRAAGDRRSSALGIDVQGLRIDVDENRHGSGQANGVGGRDEGDVRDDHLIARADARGGERKEDRGRPARRGDRVRHAEQIRDTPLELRRHVAVVQVVAAKHGQDARVFAARHLRLPPGNPARGRDTAGAGHRHSPASRRITNTWMGPKARHPSIFTRPPSASHRRRAALSAWAKIGSTFASAPNPSNDANSCVHAGHQVVEAEVVKVEELKAAAGEGHELIVVEEAVVPVLGHRREAEIDADIVHRLERVVGVLDQNAPAAGLEHPVQVAQPLHLVVPRRQIDQHPLGHDRVELGFRDRARQDVELLEDDIPGARDIGVARGQAAHVRGPLEADTFPHPLRVANGGDAVAASDVGEPIGRQQVPQGRRNLELVQVRVDDRNRGRPLPMLLNLCSNVGAHFLLLSRFLRRREVI